MLPSPPLLHTTPRKVQRDELLDQLQSLSVMRDELEGEVDQLKSRLEEEQQGRKLDSAVVTKDTVPRQMYEKVKSSCACTLGVELAAMRRPSRDLQPSPSSEGSIFSLGWACSMEFSAWVL